MQVTYTEEKKFTMEQMPDHRRSSPGPASLLVPIARVVGDFPNHSSLLASSAE